MRFVQKYAKAVVSATVYRNCLRYCASVIIYFYLVLSFFNVIYSCIHTRTFSTLNRGKNMGDGTYDICRYGIQVDFLTLRVAHNIIHCEICEGFNLYYTHILLHSYTIRMRTRFIGLLLQFCVIKIAFFLLFGISECCTDHESQIKNVPFFFKIYLQC